MHCVDGIGKIVKNFVRGTDSSIYRFVIVQYTIHQYTHTTLTVK